MEYKIISTGQVIIANQTFMDEHYPNDYMLIGPVPAPPDPYEWLIDVGPFYDRFGPAKMAVLTSTDVGVQAIVKDVSIRAWIDLKRDDVAQSLAYIGTKVPAVTSALQTSIITNPVQPTENMALRNTKVFG